MTTMIEALELSGQHIGKKVHIAIANGPSIIDELVSVFAEDRGIPSAVEGLGSDMAESTDEPRPHLWIGVRLRRTVPAQVPPWMPPPPLDTYFLIPETQIVEVMDS